MSRTTLIALALFALVSALTTGCSEAVVTPAASPTAAQDAADAAPDDAIRKIVLSKGDRLGYRVSAEGDVVITLTVLAGKPDAGVYTTEDADMLEVARNAKNALGDPNTVVTCGVNGDGEIVTIAYAVTLGGSE